MNPSLFLMGGYVILGRYKHMQFEYLHIFPVPFQHSTKVTRNLNGYKL